MELTTWDRLVLSVTGSLPKKTQAKLDEIRKQELQATIERAKAAAAKAASTKKVVKATSDKDLVKGKATAPAPKKKATPAKKKPSK